MGCYDKGVIEIIQIIFVILNIVLFLTGFGLIGIGAYSQYHLNTFALFNNSPYITMVPIILMISGILIVVTPIACIVIYYYDHLCTSLVHILVIYYIYGLVLILVTLMLLPTFIITMTYKVSILYCDESMVFFIFEHFSSNLE